MSEKLDFSNSQVNHGSHSGYVRGCRCDDCRAGHANYQKVWRERRAEEDQIPPYYRKNQKKYAKVVTTKPPQSMDDWQSLDPDEFWFFITLLQQLETEIEPGEPIEWPLPQDRIK